MNPQTLTSTLSSLRKAGSVFGVIFAKQNEVLFSDAPFVPERVTEMAGVLDDIAFFFQKENRQADQLAFGYDGGNLLIVFDELFRLIVLHSIHDEVDFIAKAGRAFLKDYQMAVFANELRMGLTVEQAQAAMIQSAIVRPEEPEPEPRDEEARPITQQISLKAEKAVDPTEPINPDPVVKPTEPINPAAATATAGTATPTPAPQQQQQPAPTPAPSPAPAPAASPEPASPDPAPTPTPASTPSVPVQKPLNRPAAEKQEAATSDEPGKEQQQPAAATQTQSKTEAEKISTLEKVIEEETKASTVELNREHTAPILAPVQPESTLPPPKKVKVKR